MPTTPATPDEQRWRELARVIENLTGQAQALADTGGRESERVTSLEQATHQVQEAVASLAQRQGAGACGANRRYEPNSLVGQNVVPDGLTNKANFKQWSCR